MRALWQSLPRHPVVPLSGQPYGCELSRIRSDRALHETYIRRFQAGEPGVADILCQVNYPMIAKIVREFKGGSETVDLVQEGRIGLLEGCARYDWSKATYPMAYLYQYIRMHIRHAVTQRGSVIRLSLSQRRRQLGKKVVFTFTELYDDVHGDDVDRAMRVIDQEVDQLDDVLALLDVEAEYPAILAYLTETLTPIEYDVIQRRIVQVPAETLSEIGTSKGLSRERIRQIEERALRRLRDRGEDLINGQSCRTFNQWTAAIAVALRKKESKGQKKDVPELNIGVRAPPSGSRGSEVIPFEHAPLA